VDALSRSEVAVGTLLAVVSVLWGDERQKRWRRNGAQRTWLAAAVWNQLAQIANAHLFVEIRVLRAQTTSATEIRARVVDRTALLFGIRKIAIRVLAAVDRQFLDWLWLRRGGGQWRGWFLARADEQVDPAIANVVLHIVEQIFRTLELVRGVANAAEVDVGALLVLRRERAIGLALEFVRRQRSNARNRGLGRFRRRLGASNAGEDFVVVVAQLRLLVEVQAFGTRPLETIAVRADVVDLTALLGRIGVLSTGLVLAIDGQLFGDHRRRRHLDLAGGRRFLAGARDDVLEGVAPFALDIEVHVAGAFEFGTDAVGAGVEGVTALLQRVGEPSVVQLRAVDDQFDGWWWRATWRTSPNSWSSSR